MREPDGMLKGWNSTVRTTTAIRRAWTMTLIVSQRPPSSFFTLLPTYLPVLSLTSIDLCFRNTTARAVSLIEAVGSGFHSAPCANRSRSRSEEHTPELQSRQFLV